MEEIEVLGNYLALPLLTLAGLTGLLALASPRLFGLVVNYAGRTFKLAKATSGAGQVSARSSDWIDIDQFAIRNARLFGLLMTGTAAYLWILAAFGPAACPKSLLVLIVGGFLGATFLAMFKIMVQKQQIEHRLMEAHTDKLTGLANRRAFDLELVRRLSQRQRQGTPLSLMIIDVDHFKQVNDTYGHQAGDAILTQVAQILIASGRVMDLAARIGGDEFAVSLSGTDLAEARLAVERLRTAICDQPFRVDGRELPLTVSIGLADAMCDDDAESLVKRADTALYAAKQAGRNRSYCQGCLEPVPCG